MPTPYKIAPGPSVARHAPDWHAACPNVTLVNLDNGPNLWCPDCRCHVNAEAVSTKVDLNDSFKPGPVAPVIP